MDTLFITIGIIINILIFYYIMKNLYTKNRLKGAYGMQGHQGDIGPKGLQGPRGPRGLQGGPGEDGNPGIQGNRGKDGERIYCSTSDCIDKRVITTETDNEKIWPSKDCRKSLFTGERNEENEDTANLNGYCGRNWVWENNTNERCNNGSTNGWHGNVWDDGSISEGVNQTYKWSATQNNASELGAHFSSSIDSCNPTNNDDPARKGNCPTIRRNLKCRDLTSKNIHPAEGSCRSESKDNLKNNALIFCCGQDGKDIENNNGSACLVTGKNSDGTYTYSKNRFNKCNKGPVKVRDTTFGDNVNRIYRNSAQPATQGGNVTYENVRSWCIGDWGCCNGLSGQKRYQNENWRQSYCRNLHSGFIEKDSLTQREINRLNELGTFEGNPPNPYNKKTDTNIRGPYKDFSCREVRWRKVWLGDPKSNCSDGMCQPLKVKNYNTDGSNKLGQDYRWEAVVVNSDEEENEVMCSRKESKRTPGCIMKKLPKRYIKCCKWGSNGKCIGGPIDCSGFAENSRVKRV